MEEQTKYEVETVSHKEVFDPGREMEYGAKAADALVKIVRKAGLAKKFGGEKEHLFYEAWQSIAKFYGSTVKTHDAELVDIDGIKGAKARAEILDDKTGMIVGGAEAYCMRDERNWTNKPWFQLASMAQTRAGSKACRNKWAFVPALAGFATCPAEEMDGVEVEKVQPLPTPPPEPKKPEQAQPEDPITEPQRKRFYAIAKGTGASDDQIKIWLYRNYGIEHTKNIPKSKYEEICRRADVELINDGGGKK